MIESSVLAAQGLANFLGGSQAKTTIISWEKGRRKPTGATLRLLELVRKKPEILQEV